MALATLDGLTFRINPNSIKWNFTINTSVTNTIGGRVVQVLGATLSDLTVAGDYGQDHSKKGEDGLSWVMAEQFVAAVKKKAIKQTSEVNVQGQTKKTLPVLDFRFPDYGWHFGVYVLGLSAREGETAISHTVGNFSYGYVLRLFIVEERSDTAVKAGGSMSSGKGVIDKKKAQAIGSYVARISAGVGWKKSEFNDPQFVREASTGGTAPQGQPNLASARNVTL
jgi:hypothetical protein